jgi:(1->4)-alpha-D-glucan 1-alpha-D-glucosylmutase
LCTAAALAPGSRLNELYVVVEKILSTNEALPADWPVCGTTGYEFLHAVNDLLVDKENAQAFNRIYARWGAPHTVGAGLPRPYRDLVYQKKFLTLQVSLSSELNMLAIQLDRLSEKNRASRDFTLNGLRRALREIIACFEVYRTYITEEDVLPRDAEYVNRAVAQAKRRNPALSAALFDFVRDMLLLRPGLVGDADRPEQVRFVGKFQQLSAPVMAKGVEDTTFYVYNRLVSLNEVGGDPKQFGSSVATFHARNQYRQAHYPHGLSATATHDTKRGEDARARIDVLSEVPRLWGEALSRWSRLNKRHRLELDEEDVPDRNEEYFLYQTLVGAWPLGPYGPPEQERFRERIQAYMQKALHEAKVHTSWVNPNPAYDRAVERFVARVLDDKRNARFLEDFRAFQRRVSHYGLFNALSQALLKVASPGVPDIYQGTELWDFSLVDPDNRRPVNYEERRRQLAGLRARAAGARERLPAFARELTEAREDGRIKMYLLMRALHCRRDHPALFTTGEYRPAHASLGWDDNVCAFVRRHEGRAALAAVPRLLTRRIGPDELPLGPSVWKGALLFAPGLDAGRPLRNVFTGELLRPETRDGQPCLPLAEVFANFPVALLIQEG